MIFRRKARRLMTLRTNLGPGGFQFSRMRLMAVAAYDALCIHQALFERMVVEDLVFHLTVVFEQFFNQERRQMRIQERLARTPILMDFAAARMTVRAKLDFVRDRARRALRRAAGFRIGGPFDFLARRMASIETLVGPPGIATVFRPIEMTAARSMATLATDADLGKTRVKNVFLGIIAFADSGRMSFGAHEIPVLH